MFIDSQNGLDKNAVFFALGSNRRVRFLYRHEGPFPGHSLVRSRERGSRRDSVGNLSGNRSLLPPSRPGEYPSSHQLRLKKISLTQCPHRILAFSSGHGLFNIRPHTVMWCECDSAFRHCLRSDRSEKSALVARVFFNQLSPPCFEFNGQSRSTCAQRAWYGRCLRWEDSKQAVWSSSRPVDL